MGNPHWSNCLAWVVCPLQWVPALCHRNPPAAVEGQRMFRSWVALGGREPTASPVHGAGDHPGQLVGNVRDGIHHRASPLVGCEPWGSKKWFWGTLVKVHGEEVACAEERAGACTGPRWWGQQAPRCPLH